MCIRRVEVERLVSGLPGFQCSSRDIHVDWASGKDQTLVAIRTRRKGSFRTLIPLSNSRSLSLHWHSDLDMEVLLEQRDLLQQDVPSMAGEAEDIVLMPLSGESSIVLDIDSARCTIEQSGDTVKLTYPVNNVSREPGILDTLVLDRRDEVRTSVHPIN